MAKNKVPIILYSYDLPIFVAIRYGHTEIVKFLADTPRELQRPSIDKMGQSVLYCAISSKNLEVVKYLVGSQEQDLYQVSGGDWIIDGITHSRIRKDSLFHACN